MNDFEAVPALQLSQIGQECARSSGVGIRSKCTPSVDAIGGAPTTVAVTCTRLKNSM